jgi:hypothetical protein
MKEIKLPKGFTAMVDDDDFERLSAFSWLVRKASKLVYAVRHERINGKIVWHYMHREILNPPNSAKIDHIDRNGLNNTRSNLRLCSHKENMWNRSGSSNASSKYKGVYLDKIRGKWGARIMVNGNPIRIGNFYSEKVAALAYDLTASYHYKEFAFINNVDPSDMEFDEQYEFRTIRDILDGLNEAELERRCVLLNSAAERMDAFGKPAKFEVVNGRVVIK